MKELSNIGYELIMNEVDPGTRVLDLGCGDGSLLAVLQDEKRIEGLGVEILEENVSLCLEKGLYCFQADIDEGLTDYPDNSFDCVIISQTLQNTRKPEYIMKEILRIGKKAVVSFPNFACASVRLQFLFRGRMPKTGTMPYEWFETPNIHMVTIDDFTAFCRKRGYIIEKTCHFSLGRDGSVRRKRFLSNCSAQYGFFVLKGTSVR